MSALDALPAFPPGRFDEAAYLTLLDGVTEDGRWELIDGIPIQTPPVTLRHVRIATNLERLLNRALAAGGRTIEAMRETALRHPSDIEFRPIADVGIIDPAEVLESPQDRFYDRCFLAAEVLSPSTAHYDLVWKLPRYREWPDCRYVLLISQEKVEARFWPRADRWSERTVRGGEILDLPEFGLSCALGDLYRGTTVS